MNTRPEVGGRYQHYKGNIYEVLLIVQHTETEEEMVVYEDTADRSKKWTRPLEMFIEQVVVDGEEKLRFTKIN